MQCAVCDRTGGRLVELRVMMRLQYCEARDSITFIRQRDPNDASRVGAVLHADQITSVPIKAVDTSSYHCVRLRQSRRLAAGFVDARDSGRQCYGTTFHRY